MPVEISTKDSIVSEHFYGKGEESADEEITNVERKLARLVDGLRSGDIDPDKHREGVGELISHISIRTRAIRNGFEKIADRFTGDVADMLTSENLVTRIVKEAPDTYLNDQFVSLIADSHKYPGLPQVLDWFKSLGISESQLSELIVSNMRGYLSDSATNAEFDNEANEFIKDVFEQLKKTVPDSIRDGHIRSLKQATVPDTRIKLFREFEWQLQDCDFDVVLGDSGVIFKSLRHDRFVISTEFDDIAAVVLPISQNKVLLGLRSAGDGVCLDTSLNEAIVRCSVEQFIANVNSELHRSLIARIGLDAYFPVFDEMEAAVDELRSDMEGFIASIKDTEGS